MWICWWFWVNVRTESLIEVKHRIAEDTELDLIKPQLSPTCRHRLSAPCYQMVLRAKPYDPNFCVSQAASCALRKKRRKLKDIGQLICKFSANQITSRRLSRAIANSHKEMWVLFLKLHTHTVRVKLTCIEEEWSSQWCDCGGFKQNPKVAVACSLRDPESRRRISSSYLLTSVLHRVKFELDHYRGRSVLVAVNFFELHEEYSLKVYSPSPSWKRA